MLQPRIKVTPKKTVVTAAITTMDGGGATTNSAIVILIATGHGKKTKKGKRKSALPGRLSATGHLPPKGRGIRL